MKEIPEMNVSKISIPVLIINGASDGLTPVAGAKLLADKLPNAELEIVEKAAHLVMIEQPEHVNELIIKFIQQ
jgi:pimeloyl-ACP methyl ester carboxylesterase